MEMCFVVCFVGAGRVHVVQQRDDLHRLHQRENGRSVFYIHGRSDLSMLFQTGHAYHLSDTQIREQHVLHSPELRCHGPYRRQTQPGDQHDDLCIS